MATKTIFVSRPYREEFQDVYYAILTAVEFAERQSQQKLEVVSLESLSAGVSWELEIQRAISTASLVIADVSDGSPAVSREVGMADALGKPVLLVIDQDYLPVSMSFSDTMVLYDRSILHRDLVPQLVKSIVSALREPRHYTPEGRRKEEAKLPEAFVSYSHADDDSLKRLLVHLKPLRKTNKIEVWDDTQIQAGDNWREEISKALDRASIAVLLVSADFLASDFIVDDELPPILRSAADRGTKILPVILKPCRFEQDKKLSQFQAINRPSEPVLGLSPIEQEHVWNRVALAIEARINHPNS